MAIYKNINNQRIIRGSEEGGFRSRSIAQRAEPFFLVCPECGAIKQHKRWFFDREIAESQRQEHEEVICPVCEAIKNGWYEGVVAIQSEAVNHISGQIDSLIRHQEAEHRLSDPKNRIVSIDKKPNEWRIYTASPFLARQIGEHIASAYCLKTRYKWSDGERLVKVLVY